MDSKRRTYMIVVFLPILLALAVCSDAQKQATPDRNMTGEEVRSFYQALAHEPKDGKVSSDTAYFAAEALGKQSREEIEIDLPLVLEALSSENLDARKEAGVALFAVGQRPDGAQILAPAIGPLARLLDDDNPDVQNGAVSVLADIKPLPPPPVEKIFTSYLERTDRSPLAQTGALFYLVRFGSPSAETMKAMNAFLDRPLDSENEINALNALGDPRAGKLGLTGQVIRRLSNADPAVRQTAVSNLMQIGPAALRQAEPALQQILQSPAETDEVKRSAMQALNAIHH